MGHKQSIAGIQSKDATTSRRQINGQMVQNVLLVWLDGKVDQDSDECRNTTTQLRHSVNNIHIFTDGEEFVQFMEGIQIRV